MNKLFNDIADWIVPFVPILCVIAYFAIESRWEAYSRRKNYEELKILNDLCQKGIITREEFEERRKGRSFRIVFKRDEQIDRISESYADVGEGEKLALFNSAGYLEIAIQKGNAAGLFGLQDFTEQSQNQYLQSRLFYQTIRVFFE